MHQFSFHHLGRSFFGEKTLAAKWGGIFGGRQDWKSLRRNEFCQILEVDMKKCS